MLDLTERRKSSQQWSLEVGKCWLIHHIRRIFHPVTFLFPRVKESLRGVRFEDAEAINRAFRNSLQQQGNSGMQGGLFGLVSRRQKCIELSGDYVE